MTRGPGARAFGWLAWGVTLACALLAVASLWVFIAGAGDMSNYILWSAVIGLTFPVVGAVIATTRPRNAIAWVFLAIGLAMAPVALARAYVASNSSAPGAGFAAWLVAWLWMPGMGLMTSFALLLFPDGRLPSPRWRWIAALAALSITVASLDLAIWEWGAPASALDQGQQGSSLLNLWLSLFGASALASAASLLARYRRSDRQQRARLKWMAYAGGLTVAVIIPAGAIAQTGSPPLASTIAVPLVPIAAGIAILRHQLYDIDVVISKTIVFGGLAAFVTVVYVGLVVAVGTLIRAGDEPNLMLSIAATAVVAVAFQPVRERLARFANRLVYGVRATPYEILSRFSSRLGEATPAEETLERMAMLLADGTGAKRTTVWLRLGEQLRMAASWPPEDQAATAAPLPLRGGEQLPDLRADIAAPVLHHGELLGALTVTKSRGEALTPTEDKLLADLAAQAGLVLRNVRLTAQLLDRLEELRASRQRLVTAQDEERRRLERNLHDGAQQQLVALKIKLGLARSLADREQAPKTAGVLADLSTEAEDAIATLRDLARGIYPPLLAGEGLPAALKAQARKAALPVSVLAEGVGRYDKDVEAAVYFCCLEALQNIAKHAEASQATIAVSHSDGALTFTITDDGQGFDSDEGPRGAGLLNMADRLDALGGALAIASRPGEGTAITARLPAAPRASVLA